MHGAMRLGLPSTLAILALLSACAGGVETRGRATAAASAPPAKPAEGAHPTGVDFAGMDRAVQPGDDFYRFANGTWLNKEEIPADRSSWGIGAMVSERTLRRTQEILAAIAQDPAKATTNDARKIGDYYASFLDEKAIESRGLAPAKAALLAIEAIADRKALARAIGATLRADVDVLNATHLDTDNLLGVWVAQDLDTPTRYSAYLLQGGLEMPDREYYLASSPRMTDVRDKYQTHIARMFALAGYDDARARAWRVFALEKKLANAHVSREHTEDVKKGNNHLTRAQLAELAPGIDWNELLGAAGLDKVDGFVVWQPGAVAGMAGVVANEPLQAWREYLTFHFLERHASVLPKAFAAESFAFHGTVLNGTPVERDRWKRAVDATTEAMGEAVGRLYVERYFPASEKRRAEAMVKNVLAAFARRLDALTWMAPATKAQAKAKLAALRVSVGYPDTWRDYSGLDVIRGDAFGNFDRASRFAYTSALAKLGHAVDRGEWVMNPHVVNAVNLPAMNALNFPAGILQPPDFDPARPEAMDYGSAGAMIGHEICHSFDDTGALFDATGKMRDWWTPDDFAHFRASSEALAKQYDAYQPFPDIHVSGKLTSSENIADVAGLAAAFDAYRLANGGAEGPTVHGLRGDQQFFLSFAQGWRAKLREAAARRRLVTDGHAPPEFRADTVRNVDAWYDAWSVKPGQRLYLDPPSRVRVY